MVSNYYRYPDPVVAIYAAGISNAGSLTLLNCAIRNCTNHGEGYILGGGIYNTGELLMQHCLVADCATYAPGASLFGRGGGIANDEDLRMEDCTVSRCSARIGGGIANLGNMLLTNCIIDSCQARNQSNGGGIANQGSLVAHSCTISNCSSTYAGGGIAFSAGSAALTNCTLMDNGAIEWGGGFGTEYWGPDALNVILYGCTIAGNVAMRGGGVGGYGADFTLFNCTVSENATYSLMRGGGIDINGVASLNHCTVSLNRAGTGGGVFGNVQSQNSIFAGNGGGDVSGVLTSAGYNLIFDTNGCTIANNKAGNIYGADPRLGPLQDNGGPTWTHALLPGSPAIDAGSSEGASVIDQRGIPRPQGLAPDIGAFDFRYQHPGICANGSRILHELLADIVWPAGWDLHSPGFRRLRGLA